MKFLTKPPPYRYTINAFIDSTNIYRPSKLGWALLWTLRIPLLMEQNPVPLVRYVLVLTVAAAVVQQRTLTLLLVSRRTSL